MPGPFFKMPVVLPTFLKYVEGVRLPLLSHCGGDSFAAGLGEWDRVEYSVAGGAGAGLEGKNVEL